MNNTSTTSSPSAHVSSLQELAAFSTLKNVYMFPNYSIPKHIVNIVGDVAVKEQHDRYRNPSMFYFNSFRVVLRQFLYHREEMVQMKLCTMNYLRRGDHPPLLTIERPIFDDKGSYYYMQEYCPGGLGPILPVYPLMDCVERVVKRDGTSTCD